MPRATRPLAAPASKTSAPTRSAAAFLLASAHCFALRWRDESFQLQFFLLTNLANTCLLLCCGERGVRAYDFHLLPRLRTKGAAFLHGRL